MLEALVPIGRCFPAHPGEPAAIPHQQGKAAALRRWYEELHVHALDEILAVRVDPRGQAARSKHDFPYRLGSGPIKLVRLQRRGVV